MSIDRLELRAAILDRLDTFAADVHWIGGSADLAFTDSVIELMNWAAGVNARPEPPQERLAGAGASPCDPQDVQTAQRGSQGDE